MSSSLSVSRKEAGAVSSSIGGGGSSNAYSHYQRRLRTHPARPRIRYHTLSALTMLLLLISTTTCQGVGADVVSTDYLCYESNDSILVQFATAMPTMQNWVGLVAKEQNEKDSNSNATLVRHQWSCGSHDEECPQKHRVYFQDLANLLPGLYHVRLIAHGYHGLRQTLESPSFRILPPGKSCQHEEDGWHLDSIQVGQRHYTTGTQLEILFARTKPEPWDAVGLYPASVTRDEISRTEPLVWLWTACAPASKLLCQINTQIPPTTSGIPHGTLSLPLVASKLHGTGYYQAVLGKATLTTANVLLLEPLATTLAPIWVVDTTKTSPSSTRRSIYRLDDEDDSIIQEDDNRQRPCIQDVEDTILVQTPALCFVQGMDIPVTLSASTTTKCTTTASMDEHKDRIGIYPSYVDLSFHHGTSLLPPSPRLWLYACGSKDCGSSTALEDEEEFSKEGNDQQEEPTWPLPVGTYKTVLIRQQQRDVVYYYYYESKPFDIVHSSCEISQRRHLRHHHQQQETTTSVVFSYE